MSNIDSNQQHPNNIGGHEAELTKAATRMADAIVSGDPIEMRLAASDHAAALGSQATAMVSSIVTILVSLLDDKLQPVVTRLANIDSSSLTWRSELRQHLDSRFDAYGKELDELKGGLARLTKSELEITNLKMILDAHTIAIEALQQQGRDDTTAALLRVEQRIETLAQEHEALKLRLELRSND